MQYFLDRNLTVRRQRYKDLNRSAFSATATAYPAGLQQMEAADVAVNGGTIGKMYDIFVEPDTADIQDGDEVVINGKKYGVQGVDLIDFGGSPHLRIVGVLKDV